MPLSLSRHTPTVRLIPTVQSHPCSATPITFPALCLETFLNHLLEQLFWCVAVRDVP